MFNEEREDSIDQYYKDKEAEHTELVECMGIMFLLVLIGTVVVMVLRFVL